MVIQQLKQRKVPLVLEYLPCNLFRLTMFPMEYFYPKRELILPYDYDFALNILKP